MDRILMTLEKKKNLTQWLYKCTKGGPVNRGLCLLYKKTIQCTGFQFTCILRKHVLGMHIKLQKNTPKNKISVYNTNTSHADPAHADDVVYFYASTSCTTCTYRLLFIEVRSVVCDTQAMFVPTFETCH